MRHRILRRACLAATVAAALGAAAAPTDDLAIEAIVELAHPLEDAGDLDPLMEWIGDRRIVLLGESTHGTADFYQWRDTISRRLIAEKGFRFIAVEGDWAACHRINAHVKGLPGAEPDARALLASFDRWPTWLWANEETLALVEWLRAHNADLPPARRVGFYGIDLYGVRESLDTLIAHLRDTDPEGAALAEAVDACLRPFWPALQAYGRAAGAGAADCSGAVARLARHLAAAEPDAADARYKAWFNAKRNAAVIRGAEAHFRAMGDPAQSSWNVRVAHFLETVDRLMDFKGADAKGIVWAHNTHIGDARATAMSAHGSQNIGQLLRQGHGAGAVFAVGFGTHAGRVVAARAWEASRETMRVPPGVPGSVEDLMRRAAGRMERPRFLLRLGPDHWHGPLAALRGHRAIGVTYQPEQEAGNYVPTRLAQRYDAFIFIGETGPLRPIHP